MGRMTARLAELYGAVIALDLSPEMLVRARAALTGYPNISYILGGGTDLASPTTVSAKHCSSPFYTSTSSFPESSRSPARAHR
jgi:hypothetical protein